MEIEKILTTIGIDYAVIQHPAVFTVAESMEHLPDAFPVKNLLLIEEKGERCVFVIMKGDERLNTKHLQQELDCKKLQFAKPGILMDRLGVEPGSASLFSLAHDGSAGVEVVIDKQLIDQKEVGFHPSINTQTIIIAGSDIEIFLRSINRSFRTIQL